MSLCVMDVDRGRVLPDMVPGDVNPVAHAWHTKNQVVGTGGKDNECFFYTRSRHDVGCGEARSHRQCFFPSSSAMIDRDDPLVFDNLALLTKQTPYPQLSSDGRYLLVVVYRTYRATSRALNCIFWTARLRNAASCPS